MLFYFLVITCSKEQKSNVKTCNNQKLKFSSADQTIELFALQVFQKQNEMSSPAVSNAENAFQDKMLVGTVENHC